MCTRVLLRTAAHVLLRTAAHAGHTCARVLRWCAANETAIGSSLHLIHGGLLAEIRKESEEYVCAKDHKSAASLELKAKIDSRQSNCLSWAEQKESQAAMCVDLVNREMMKLDEYIANIDESIFTNMEEEDMGAARGAAGGMGSRSGGGGIGGGGHDRKRKSGGGDRNAWIQEGAMCEVGWNPNCWAVLTCMQFCTHACTYACIHARAPSLYACTCVENNDVCAYRLSLSLSLLYSILSSFLFLSGGVGRRVLAGHNYSLEDANTGRRYRLGAICQIGGA